MIGSDSDTNSFSRIQHEMHISDSALLDLFAAVALTLIDAKMMPADVAARGAYEIAEAMMLEKKGRSKP